MGQSLICNRAPCNQVVSIGPVDRCESINTQKSIYSKIVNVITSVFRRRGTYEDDHRNWSSNPNDVKDGFLTVNNITTDTYS